MIPEDARALSAMLASPRFKATAEAVFARVFAAHDGNAFRAAPALGMSHRTLRRLCAAYPSLQRTLDRARGSD